jgi:Skp family chaperone for outer membrane proteins
MMLPHPSSLRANGVLVGSVLGLAVAAAALSAGCSSAMIATKEYFGISKREQMVARVQDARDAQESAKQQFASALEEFQAVTGATGGDLEAKYKKLSKAYEASEAEAAAVRKRIGDVETVGNKLFAEWQTEIGEYANATLRSASEQQLAQTRVQFDRLVGVMKAAESKMNPVLAAFKDQVLFLKHNLNAQAIASLGSTATQIEGDVARLIKEMEASIGEADDFIKQMGLLEA